MTKVDSKIYRTTKYWEVHFHAWAGKEGDHIIVTQGGREIQIYTSTLDIKDRAISRWTTEEIEELREIAKSYR